MSLGPRPETLRALEGARLASIEASAGTGKTYLLERAVLQLVLQGHDLRELLVVTYTERATSELRRRVRALLSEALARARAGEAVDGWDLGRAELLERALADFSRATIATIHGFCARLLREHALLLGRGLDETLAEPREAFARAFRAVLRRELAVGPGAAELEAWLSQRSVADLEELLWRVDRHRAAELHPRLERGALARAAEALGAHVTPDALATTRAELEASKLHRLVRNAALDRLSNLEQVFGEWRDAGWDLQSGEVPLLALCGDRRLERALDYLTTRGERITPHSESFARLLSALEGLQRAQVPLEAAAAHTLLPAVRAQREAQQRASAEHDFDGLLEAVALGLDPDAPAREAFTRSVRDRYRHVLIDEAQDTDPVQWQIFSRLFLEEVPGLPSAGLWLIGDPKQAIYGFRGADVFTYLQAKSELERAGARLERLSVTYRQTPALNAALQPIISDAPPFFHQAEIQCVPTTSGRAEASLEDSAGEGLDPLVLFRFAGEGWRAQGAREAHARAIAREVQGLEKLRLRDGDRTAPVSLRDVAVLARSGKELTLVADALREAGIPTAYLKQEGLFATREAEDLLHVLRAVRDPKQRALRFRAWNTEVFAVPLEDLPRCAELPPEHPLVARLLAWHQLALAQDYPALLHGILEESGLLARELLLRRGERESTNYLHLGELLLEVALRERLEITELCERLASWVAGERLPPGEDGGVQRLEADAKAVQLLTIHKSKGLEAEVVFLFGGISDPPPENLHLFHRWGELDEDEPALVLYHDGFERIVYLGPLTPRIRGLVQRELEDEQRRLLYVALTRARARLYVPCFTREETSGKDWSYARLGGIQRHLSERIEAVLSRDAAPAGWTIRDLEPPPPLARAASSDDTIALELELPPESDGQARELLAALRPHTRLSFSRIQASRAPEVNTAHEVGALASGAKLSPPQGAHTGILVHELLETLDWSLALEEDFAARVSGPIQAGLLRAELDLAHEAGACALLRGALRTPISLPALGLELPRGLAPTEGARELDFTLPLPARAGALLESAFGAALQDERGLLVGSIDYAFVHEGRGYLVDWKTNALDDYAAAALDAVTREDYALQRELYALALAKTLAIASAPEFTERFGGVLYLYLRGCDPTVPNSGLCAWRPSWEALRRVEAELLDLAGDPRWSLP